MEVLDVVNECLGTMGETPLNSLEDPHDFNGPAQNMLDKNTRAIQAKGFWFNRESLTLAPSTLDSGIYLPGDFIAVRVPRDANTGLPHRNITQRGRRLYNTDGGTYVFTSPLKVDLIRLVPFADLPEQAASHIAAVTVLQFQSLYDGDTAKARELNARIDGKDGTLAALRIEEARNTQANLLESNYRLQRLKSITRTARYGIRR
jgi:hypothetical protein